METTYLEGEHTIKAERALRTICSCAAFSCRPAQTVSKPMALFTKQNSCLRTRRLLCAIMKKYRMTLFYVLSNQITFVSYNIHPI